MLIRLDSATVKMNCNKLPVFEFHIAKDIRNKYEIENSMFSINGNVLLADFNAVRKFTDKINAKRELSNHVRYGQLNAVGLLDEIYHFILREYEESENPKVFGKAVYHLNEKLGEDNLRKLLFEFIDLFPPQEVFHGKASAFEYLNGFTADRSNVEITIEEMLLLNIANFNPANERLKELFDENYFQQKDDYAKFVTVLEEFFKNEKPFGPDAQDIFAFFKAPILANPENLWDQLEYIRVKWDVILKEYFTGRLLSSKDLMKEDIKFESYGGGGDYNPPTVAPVYQGKVFGAENLVIGKSLFKYAEEAEHDYEEPEQFTPDVHWMPSVVLIAKNAYVWLDQLSKKYDREIKTLDQIPDEELDSLVRWNFTGLWLIGLWERSVSSKRIKHIMGNIDAVASAYSLYDYAIAYDLGGEKAFNNLKKRAESRGLRLASDMVPNHTGIHSDWVRNNPDYFVQVAQPPFANYSFNGEDLSEDPNIEIKIEDGYYAKSDAAVVFRRIDKRNGDLRYIYHGNDGTNMPWNDTAQLDMLKKEVREAVIQKIFDVAKRTSIIRFDAAMTLTKRHFSRLWYPQPGKGGDIPSRAEHALTKQQFDEFFPEEFWREVVDRINRDLPETLLLAEAFWLMEGYFVRTLGMHRVYNSAFMHMMMKEENDKYRDLITNTLEFEPEILKRYVNFMSNPDEETAIKQFGTDDKYFGVLTLMITLPGLPMFAHGQIEGFIEKYGMEYKRAYYNEEPKNWLIERHEREVFNITRKRYLFAEVDNFWFYDVIDEYGNINENVFAFTNSYENEKALVLYNNKYDQAHGRINVSTPKLVADNKGNKAAKSITLLEALSINHDENFYYICSDSTSQMEFILKGSDMLTSGYYIHLDGFQHRVLMGFEEIYDESGLCEDLYHKLQGQGVPSVKEALDDIHLTPVHESFENVFRPKDITVLLKALVTEINDESDIDEELKVVSNKFHLLTNEISKVLKKGELDSQITAEFKNTLQQIKRINNELMLNFSPATHPEYVHLNRAIVISEEANYKENFLIILLFVVLSEIHKLYDKEGGSENIVNKTQLSTPVTKILKRLGKGDIGVHKELTLLIILLDFHTKLFDEKSNDSRLLDVETKSDIKDFVSDLKGNLVEKILGDENVQSFLLINEYKGVVYFSKERFEELTDWLFTIALLKFLDKNQSTQAVVTKDGEIVDEVKSTKTVEEDSEHSENPAKEFITKLTGVSKYIKVCSEQSGYQLDKLKEILLNQ